MNRPYIICHMVTSLDGKVTGEWLSRPEAEAATELYYQINREYAADGFACGRVTMEGSFTGGLVPDLSSFQDVKIDRSDYAADASAGFFAVSFDRRGRLGWTSSRIQDEDPGYGNAHIIEVLCEDAPDAYLAYLRSIGVSYIFAGADETDVSLALEKLYRIFGIKRLLLEGGSIINGVFQKAGVIDEISLVVAPTVGKTRDKPLFYESDLSDYALADFRSCDGGVVRLNYKKN